MTPFFFELHQFSSTDDSRKASSSRSVKSVVVTEALRLTIVSAVCATSQRAQDINIPVTRPFRKPRPSALFSLLAVQYWWWVDISRSRIWNLIAAFRPQFEFHKILSTKPIRSYTDLALYVHVSKGHTCIDSWKVLDMDGENCGSQRDGRTENYGVPTSNFRGNVNKNPEYFSRVFSFFFLSSFFFFRTCMSYVRAYPSILSWKDGLKRLLGWQMPLVWYWKGDTTPWRCGLTLQLALLLWHCHVRIFAPFEFWMCTEYLCHLKGSISFSKES